MKIKTLIGLAMGALMAVACASEQGTTDYMGYVNPKIGTGGHGHVFIGASVPFGLVQVGPTSIPQTWDWCSGYHESDSTVIGFSHTHLSGTGCSDLFDITVMPVVGEVTYARGGEKDPQSGLWSYADRSKEVARPNYYSIPLLRYGITAEMTATERVGLSRYTFPASDQAAIVFDLENGGGWDAATETHIEAVGDNAISGWRYSTGWAKDQKVYFVAEFSKPFDSIELIPAAEKPFSPVNMRGAKKAPAVTGERFARLCYNTEEGEQILVKVALSPVSVEGAAANMAAELPGWDFEAVEDAAADKWNAELSRVRVETSDATARTIFYTALYHSMISPALFCDENGDYRGADGEVHLNPGHKTYTTYSLWDTYRAEMPLLSITQPARYADMINNMIDICNEQGHLPVWHLWGCENYCMVGNPGIPPVADAIVKDIPGVDKEKAYAAIRQTADFKYDPKTMPSREGNTLDRALAYEKGIALRNQYGFIPSDKYNQAIAYDMEYAVADGAAAQAAKALGKDEDAQRYTERSHSYRHYFDPSIGFIRGRNADGTWRKDYNPYHSDHAHDDFVEGNGWQYTWLAPQDAKGLRDCFGSDERFVGKLDSLFTVSSELEGDFVSADISGLIGQYAHGNEPSHATLYLYAMLGHPGKTAEKVRQTLNTLYFADRDGLSGNEDAGQMSAWYILSAIGLYQAEPAGARYWFGTPLFDKVDIDVTGGVFSVVAENNSAENIYIQKVWLNGEEYAKPWITYADIMKGGELRFEMGSEPTLWYDYEE